MFLHVNINLSMVKLKSPLFSLINIQMSLIYMKMDGGSLYSGPGTMFRKRTKEKKINADFKQSTGYINVTYIQP